jgi:ATP-dependent exoDNAse (exonuclease V) alpha subunit
MAPEYLELKIGAKVMLLTNNIPFWVNGTIAYVSDFEYDNNTNKEYLVLNLRTKDGEEAIIDKTTFEEYEYSYNKEKKHITKNITGKFTQFPLKLAYAVTIHKSQSATYENAYIDFGKVFSAGQVYVGLSRLKSIDGLGIKGSIKPTDIMIHPEVREFMKTF